MSGLHNLMTLWTNSDAIDRHIGKSAYSNYRWTLSMFADRYPECTFNSIVAAFVALSPNNDYVGNLRSLASVLDGRRKGIALERITVSTYKHCLGRAYGYIIGKPFDAEGPKICNFYKNILDPNDPEPVTVDGHMAAAWRGLEATMKDSKVTRTEYDEIAADIRLMASVLGLVPCQVQATLWFTRKRILRIRYDPQLKLDRAREDPWWGTVVDPASVPPFRLGPLVGVA